MPPLPLRPPPKLLHIPLSTTSFTTASTLQSHLVNLHLRSKPPHNSPLPPPPPTLITSEFNSHIYTLGRRERDSATVLPAGAQVVNTLRGGQTTYHGPGQMTGYGIVDLGDIGLSSRCWIAGLEEGVIRTVGEYGLAGYRDERYPGVWVGGRKVCAVGVHLRRRVASFGVGLNVATDLWWFRGVTACGIEGELTTSMEMELGERVEGGVEAVAKVFVEMMKRVLGAQVVEIGRVEDWGKGGE